MNGIHRILVLTPGEGSNHEEIALAVLLPAGWCYIVVSPGDTPPPEEIAPAGDGPTRTPAPTPTAELVGFDSVCAAPPFDEIRVEGFLHLPERVACISEGEGEYCTVQLTDLVTRNQMLVSLPVEGEWNAPVPNHMVSLPIPYDSKDLMVAAEDGRWAGEGGIVRLTGQVDRTKRPPVSWWTSAGLRNWSDSHPPAGRSARRLCAPQDLIDLIELAEFAFEPARIQQFSVWTITDNPARDGYVGITASFSAEGRGPTEDELARIGEPFRLAGLDRTQYKALREP